MLRLYIVDVFATWITFPTGLEAGILPGGRAVHGKAAMAEAERLVEIGDAQCMNKHLTVVKCGLAGLEEGILPGSRAMHDEAAMAEEQRLAYVGLTRARRRLFLMHARKRNLWGPRTW